MKGAAPLETGAPGRSLGFHLTSAESVTRAIFARAVGRPMNIRATELSLLALVCENDGIGPAQVASGLGVSRPRVSQCLDFLHHRQLLERHPSSSDGRGQHLHATAAGRSLVNEACRRLTQAEAAALQCFSKAERTLMVELLARLTASVV